MKKLILVLLLVTGCSNVLPSKEYDLSTQQGRNAYWEEERKRAEAQNAAWERNCATNSETKPECQPTPLPGNWSE